MDQLPDTAVRYAEERHWDVFPGTWLEDDGSELRCSCRTAGCPSPGAHPAGPDWPATASGSVTVVRRMWSQEPRASILLPTGRAFDVIDVPEFAGCLALVRMERMDIQLGPVACTPDRRLLFFVLPGASAKIHGLPRAAGQASFTDLVVRGEGDYVPAPPTRTGTAGSVHWARPPTGLNRWLPDAGELLDPLAYACRREAVARRARG